MTQRKLAAEESRPGRRSHGIGRSTEAYLGASIPLGERLERCRRRVWAPNDGAAQTLRLECIVAAREAVQPLAGRIDHDSILVQTSK